jgi:hypothetical protein
MKRLLLAAAVMIAMTGTALANQCPKLMAEIDAAMAARPNLTAEQQAEVIKLRADGEALHASGQHAESEVTLAHAKEILGLK